MRRILAVALMAMSGMAWATQQMAEVMIVDGEPIALLAEPLAPLLARPEVASSLRTQVGTSLCTANWRGYQGTWEIRDDALYLVKLSISPCHDPREVPIDTVIPDAAAPLRATWFSGDLTIPLTKRHKHWHLEEGFMLERYELVTIAEGVVKERRTIERTRGVQGSGQNAADRSDGKPAVPVQQ